MDNYFMQKYVNIRQNAEQKKAVAKKYKLYSVIYMNMKVKHSKIFYHN